MATESATSLRRAHAILLALSSDEAAAKGGLGVIRIAVLTGREKSQVSRTLRTLSELGFVDRDPDTLSYRLGWGLISLSARAGEQRLLEATTPLLVRLVNEVGEGAHLSVLKGREVLTVLSESPGQALQAVNWVGRMVPAYCTSSGRALLLDHEESELIRLWEEGSWPRPGPNAPADVDDFCARVAQARGKGYVVADEELEAGLVAVAAPIRDERGRISAALDVSGPKFRLEGRTHLVGDRIKATSDELSSIDWRSGAASHAAGAPAHLG